MTVFFDWISGNPHPHCLQLAWGLMAQTDDTKLAISSLDFIIRLSENYTPGSEIPERNIQIAFSHFGPALPQFVASF